MDVKTFLYISGKIESIMGRLNQEEKIGITREIRDRMLGKNVTSIENLLKLMDFSAMYIGDRFEVEMFVYKTSTEKAPNIEVYLKDKTQLKNEWTEL